jgi:mRNA interferase RelE/StbE
MKTIFKKSFAGDLKKRKNDSDFTQRVKEVIQEVEKAENILDITDLKKMTNENIYYRIRTGNFRIGIKIVSVESETAVIFVRAHHRKDLYRKFP